jgi:hypothetical protein
MKIEYCTEDNIFSKLNQEYSIAFKYNDQYKLIMCCFYVNDQIYVIDKIYDTRKFLETFRNSMSEWKPFHNKIYVYDMKEFFKGYVVNEVMISNLLVERMADLKIALFNVFCREIALNSKEVLSLTGKACEAKIADFVLLNSSMQGKVDHFMLPHELLKYCANEVEILWKLRDKVSHSEYFNQIKLASYTYAKIELEGLALNKELDYDQLKRHFYNLLKGSRRGKIFYHFDHTSTGRMSSSFHSLKKDFRQWIISTNPADSIMIVDFNCFEVKVLFDRLKIECHADDIYGELTGSRDEVKQALISYMYGSTVVDSEIAAEIEDNYHIGSKIDNFKSDIKSNEFITTYGKKLMYVDNDDALRKCINGEIQSNAQVIMFSFVNELVEALALGKLKSKVIATIYDGVIINMSAVEYGALRIIIDKVIKGNKLMSSKYVNYTPSITVGPNMRDQNVDR